MKIQFKNLLKIKRPKIRRGQAWRIGLIAFFSCFIVIFVLNFYLFSGLQENLATVEEKKNFSIESVESGLLESISKNISEKESAFEKYKNENPSIKDPSL